MAVVSMKQLLEAGVHFGHQTRRWTPKMKKYIYAERNDIHIIDLQQTVAQAEIAYKFVRDIAASGKPVLFVGTKKQAQEAIKARDIRERLRLAEVNHFIYLTEHNAEELSAVMQKLERINKGLAEAELEQIKLEEQYAQVQE